MLWVGWAVIATAAPWGWLGWMTPALLLVLLFTITGIAPTEEQAVRSRGEDYLRYRRETSVFVPWFRNAPEPATERNTAAATLTSDK